jgi:hypothetical protein
MLFSLFFLDICVFCLLTYPFFNKYNTCKMYDIQCQTFNPFACTLKASWVPLQILATKKPYVWEGVVPSLYLWILWYNPRWLSKLFYCLSDEAIFIDSAPQPDSESQTPKKRKDPQGGGRNKKQHTNSRQDKDCLNKQNKSNVPHYSFA